MNLATYRFNSPILTNTRKGTADDPYVKKDESFEISNSKVILSELPDYYYKVRVQGLNQDWFEIEEGTPSLNQFKVDYQNKLVTFHPDHNGKMVNFKYQGTGIIYFPTSMIYAHQENGTVTETLDDMIRSGREGIETLKNVNEKVEEINSAVKESQKIIQDGSAMMDELDSTITGANQRITEKVTELDTQYKNILSTATTNENKRVTDENTRKSNEESRISNEATRVQSEKDRVANETKRQQQEASRQTQFTEAINTSQQVSEQTRLTKEQADVIVTNFVHKGDYSPSTTYNPLNMVAFQGSTYMNKVQSANIPPTDTSKWIPIAIKGFDGVGSVNSVNGKGGNVVLNADDIGAIHSAMLGVANGAAKLNADGKAINADGSLAGGVISVNGKDGTITLTAKDIGALPDSTVIPSKLSQLTNDSGYETATGAQAKANTAEKNAKDASIPLAQKGKANGVAGLNEAGNVIDAQGNEVKGAVSSVNSKTGDVVLSKEDIGLSNVTNDRQATKDEFDAHNNDTAKHITDAERTKWNNGATVSDASTTKKGIVMLSDSLDDESVNKAPTANAVRKINSKLQGAALSLGSGSISDTFSTAVGYEAKVTKGYSNAFGYMAVVSQQNASAIGNNASADGDSSFALGRYASAPNRQEGVLGVFTGHSLGTNIWKVPGSFSVAGTKQFEIPHPKPTKRNTHVIRHGAVESPTTGDTLYRYYVDIKGDTAEVKFVGSEDVITLPTNRSEDSVSVSIPLPDYWVWLNINEQVFISPDRHFSNGYGFVNRANELLELTFQETRKYNVALYGTRNDDHESIQTWHVKGVEREVGESWLGETYVFEDDEIIYENEYSEEEIIQ